MRLRAWGVALFCVPLWGHAQTTAGLLAVQQQVVSSLAVLTEQVNVSTNQKNSVMLQGQQAYASSLIDMDVRNAVREAVEQYGPNGQLIDGCYQLSMATQMGSTSAAAAAHASSAMAKLYTESDNGTANSGGIAGALGVTTQVTQFPFAASVSQRMARHASHYCTVSEAQHGYCTLNANGMQGGDEDFSLHLQPGKTYGWDQTEAAADFVKRVAPITPLSQASKCASPACIAALRAQRDQKSMMSMARYSFLRITEAHETQASGVAGTQ